jgi:hypothetical protein
MDKEFAEILDRLGDVETKGIGIGFPSRHSGLRCSLRVEGNPLFNEIGLKYKNGSYYADICLGSTAKQARYLFETLKWESSNKILIGVTIEPNLHINFPIGHRLFLPSASSSLDHYISFWKAQLEQEKRMLGTSFWSRQTKIGIEKLVKNLVDNKLIQAYPNFWIGSDEREKHYFLSPGLNVSIQIDSGNPSHFFRELQIKFVALLGSLGLSTEGNPWAKSCNVYADGKLAFDFCPFQIQDGCFLTFENCQNEKFARLTESSFSSGRWQTKWRYVSLNAFRHFAKELKDAGVGFQNLNLDELDNDAHQDEINKVLNKIGWGSSAEDSTNFGRINENTQNDYWQLVNRYTNADLPSNFGKHFPLANGAEGKSKYKLRIFYVGQAACSVLLKNDIPIAVFDIGTSMRNPDLSLVSFLENVNGGLFLLSHGDADHINLNSYLNHAFKNNFWLLPVPTIMTGALVSLLTNLARFPNNFSLISDSHGKNPNAIPFDIINIYQADPASKDPSQSTKENAHCLLAEINAEKTAFIPGDSLYSEYPKTFSPDFLLIPHHVCRLNRATNFSASMQLKETGEAFMPVSEKGFGKPRFHPNKEHYDLFVQHNYLLYRFDNLGHCFYFNHWFRCKKPARGIFLIAKKNFFDFDLGSV